MMHYHRSETEPHKFSWHLPPHNTSKRTTAFLREVAFCYSETAQQGDVPVGFCQGNHLFLSLLLGQLRPCLLFFSLHVFHNEDQNSVVHLGLIAFKPKLFLSCNYRQVVINTQEAQYREQRSLHCKSHFERKTSV